MNLNSEVTGGLRLGYKGLNGFNRYCMNVGDWTSVQKTCALSSRWRGCWFEFQGDAEAKHGLEGQSWARNHSHEVEMRGLTSASQPQIYWHCLFFQFLVLQNGDNLFLKRKRWQEARNLSMKSSAGSSYRSRTLYYYMRNIIL